MFKKNPILPFYLLFFGIFLLLAGRYLFADTMFMDGMIYSTIAHNIAIGKGSIWNLYFTGTMYQEFHEHPPLAMALESVYFQLFGSSRIVDKIYTFSTTIFTAIAIVQLWKTISPKKELSWTPLLFWIFVPVVFWSSSNNLLENTLTVFTTLSVIYIVKGQTKNKWFYFLLAGIFLSLGFLTKGFVALFPWAMVFFLWLFLRKVSLLKMILQTLLVILFTLLPIVILCLISPAARQSLWDYYQIQVVKSIQSISTVDSRFFIIKRMFSELILPIGIALIVYFSFFKRRGSLKLDKEQKSIAFVFISIGLAAVLPIMISMKQSGFYILAAYPFFAVAIAHFLQPQLSTFTQHILSNPFASKRFSIVSVVLFALGVSLNIYFSNGFGKDEVKVKDMRTILPYLPKNSIISICTEMNEDWTLHAYYERFKSVSLDYDVKHLRNFVLVHQSECPSFDIPKNYKEIKLKTIEYKLYKKK